MVHQSSPAPIKRYRAKFGRVPFLKGQTDKGYVLTGVTGFIGSTITDKLLSRGNKVIGIDKFSAGQKRFIEDVLNSTNFKFLEADISINGAW